MLTPLLDWRGHQLRAIDKDLGSVEDFYFDDRTWTVRYLVVDTGNWLPGRKVLIGPETIQPTSLEDKVISVNLTSSAVEDSPGIETDLPFSLQKERELRLFFRWREYWNDQVFIQPSTAGGMIPAPGADTNLATVVIDPKVSTQANPYLRSANEVQGYTMRASAEDLGEVFGFIVQDETWRIRYLILETGNWLIGKKFLLSPEWVSGIDWSHRIVNLEMTRKTFENAPVYTPGEPITREDEKRLFDYHQKSPDWE